MSTKLILRWMAFFPGAYTNANHGVLHGSRGKSGDSEKLVMRTPSRSILFSNQYNILSICITLLLQLILTLFFFFKVLHVFDLNAPATSTERPPLSDLTNQSFRPNGINSTF